jgi:hypothetical protein
MEMSGARVTEVSHGENSRNALISLLIRQLALCAAHSKERLEDTLVENTFRMLKKKRNQPGGPRKTVDVLTSAEWLDMNAGMKVKAACYYG